MQRINVSLDDAVFGFIERHGGKNRSGFINRLLREVMTQWLDNEAKQASHDAGYDETLAQWEACNAESLRHEG